MRMFLILVFIFSILTGITALIFLILGLINHSREKTIGGGIALVLALILFFYSITRFFEFYFDFLGSLREKSFEHRYESYHDNDEIMVTDKDFTDTIYDANGSAFIYEGVEEINTTSGPLIVAIYLPVNFNLCYIEEISLKNDRQLNIMFNNDCSESYPGIAEIYTENDIITNNSSFVQFQPNENGDTEVQYILRKDLNKDESHYLVLKYE